MSSSVCVFTCATHSNKNLENFKNSFNLYKGWDVRVLGLGSEWESFRTKMTFYRKGLKDVDEDQIVVCLDAYDVLCIKDSTDFIDLFLSYKIPIMIGCEITSCFTIYNKYLQIGCCPNIEKWKRFHNLQDKIYVNSGCIIGYAGEIFKMFDWILKYNDFVIQDDQIGVGFYMNEFPHKVKLDIKNDFVFNDTLGNSIKLRQEEEKLELDIPKKPYFIHFPGEKRMHTPTNYDKISSFMLDVDIDVERRKNIRVKKYFIYVLIVIIILCCFFFLMYRKK